MCCGGAGSFHDIKAELLLMKCKFCILSSDLAASRANVGLDRADPRCVRLRSYVLQRKAAVVVSNRLCFRNEHTAIRPQSLFCRMTMQITSALHTKSLFDNMNQSLSVTDPFATLTTVNL